MICTIVLCSLWAQTATSQGSFDPRTIPADQRIAYVNRLGDRSTGPNAAEHYRAAFNAYKTVLDLIDKSVRAMETEQRRNATAPYYEVFDNLRQLALRRTWSDEQARVVREWLRANEQTLAAIEAAARCERFHEALTAASSRLYEADVMPVRHVQLGVLVAVQARELALRGQWDEAWRWHARYHRMATHLYGLPFDIQHMVAIRLEREAHEQFRALLRDCPASDLNAIWRPIAADEKLRRPEAHADDGEALFAWDCVEALHEWADDESRHPRLRQTIEFALKPIEDIERLYEGRPPFADVDGLKQALRTSNLEDAWKVRGVLHRLYDEWDRKPFHEAWREVTAFRERYCEAAKAEPAEALYGCGGLVTVDRMRLLRATVEASRAASQVLVACHEYRRQHGRWPRDLDELVPASLSSVPLDPFSGKALIYRLRDGDGETGFVLYGVGQNQQDDGGVSDAEDLTKGDTVFWPVPVR